MQTTWVQGAESLIERIKRLNDELRKKRDRLRAARRRGDDATDGAAGGRDYYSDPFIPPWAIGSGLGGLLTPGPNTGSGDPDPTNTNLPGDGGGG